MSDTEEFWRGPFGNHYIDRNVSKQLLASNIHLFSKILARTTGVKSIIELGANVGINLDAIHCLLPDAELTGLELNKTAFDILVKKPFVHSAIFTSLLTWFPHRKWDMSFVKGLLIHIDPNDLPVAYANLYNSSSRYIVICEYHNPTPVSITYRGHEDKMFKRDFAGEMIEKYNDLRVIGSFFSWKHDPNFPQDDIFTVILEKNNARAA